MVTDLLCPVSWRSAPGSFVSLMTLYESNYIRLGWILQDLNGLQGRHVSRGADGVGLHLEVIERSRYTTLLNLSYRFAGDLGEVVTPDMQVRVYHVAGNPHSDTMLMVYVPRERVVIEVDAYSPGPGPHIYAANLLENIDKRKLRVDRIVPLHGTIGSMADFRKAVPQS